MIHTAVRMNIMNLCETFSMSFYRQLSFYGRKHEDTQSSPCRCLFDGRGYPLNGAARKVAGSKSHRACLGFYKSYYTRSTISRVPADLKLEECGL
ncbi:hypothetical protein AVEN_136133-1 [Araneus ventricosus]|uniref:Uncharacterized protein n=1 Tax=Araneus ventricosus TaxID=182803 RepID=A0A4Y2PTL3_ARAVE|nr:hypothetical protein AVEN_136133-1 [Araneus ventricosus]